MATRTKTGPSNPFECLLSEGVDTVIHAAAREGLKISAKTALRWCLQGVRGVKLENVKVVGRRMTSRAAIRRFVAATQTPEAPTADGLDVSLVGHDLGDQGQGRGAR